MVEQKWPKCDNRFLEETNVNLIIQVNGKKKLVITAPKGLTKDQTEKIVLNNVNIKNTLNMQMIKKIIVIPDRVVNLVI